MRNHIVKTALISFAGAIGAIVLFVGVCMLFFPAVVSDGAYNMGMTELSVTFAERAYEKYEDDESLKVLVERAILAEEHDAVVGYSEALIKCKSFASFAEAEDNKSLVRGPYLGFIAGNLSVSLYEQDKKLQALEVAIHYTPVYEKYNAIEHLIIKVVSEGDKQFAQDILNELCSFSFEGDEATLLNQHVQLLEGFIG